jgi:hypothetical protein
MRTTIKVRMDSCKLASIGNMVYDDCRWLPRVSIRTELEHNKKLYRRFTQFLFGLVVFASFSRLEGLAEYLTSATIR